MSNALPRVGCGTLLPLAKERELLGSVTELVQGREMFMVEPLTVAVEIILVVSLETGVPILVLPLTEESREK